jgi:hypothetical protein
MGAVRERIVFTGRFEPASFADFAAHRAARLALDLAVEAAGRYRVVLSVGGQEALVDAFEMACSLGPIDCVVLDVERGPAGEGGRV